MRLLQRLFSRPQQPEVTQPTLEDLDIAIRAETDWRDRWVATHAESDRFIAQAVEEIQEQTRKQMRARDSIAESNSKLRKLKSDRAILAASEQFREEEDARILGILKHSSYPT